ncbi:unnamed protein product [Protopolystoma xenopodis]|uniref:Uncharacterized protein n=1 Tax=Protopolystoma xenopodis TaxID=117903 RepID=A0A448X8T8_9PLAT|nr:unnamed protein product [Protopolystoma xenopodis]
MPTHSPLTRIHLVLCNPIFLPALRPHPQSASLLASQAPVPQTPWRLRYSRPLNFGHPFRLRLPLPS